MRAAHHMAHIAVVTWTHLTIAGLGFDVAGAVIIAWSLAATTAATISHDIPIHGISFGLPHIALGSARQRAEARLGMVLLGGGFLLQALTYFFPHPRAGLHTTMQRLIGICVIAGTWLLAIAIYKLYVPRATERVYDRAQRQQQPAPPDGPQAG